MTNQNRKLRIDIEVKANETGLTETEKVVDQLNKTLQLTEPQLRDVNEAASHAEQGLGDVRQESHRLGESLDDTGADALTLEQRLERVVEAFEDTKSTSISLRSEFKRLLREGTGNREMFDALSQKIEKASQAEHEAIINTRQLAHELAESRGTTVELDQDLNKLIQNLDESEKYITGIGGAAKRASKDMNRLSDSVDGVSDTMDKTGRRVETAVNSMGDRIGAVGTDIKESLVGSFAVGDLISDGLQEGVQYVKEFVQESITEYARYDDAVRRTFSQIPDLSDNMKEHVSEDARLLAAELGILPEEVLPAIRKGLNLGIEEENVFSDVALAAQAARIGGEELIGTLVAGQNVVNAYGGSLYDLEDVYDQFIGLTNASNLELTDLVNGGIADIISAGADAGFTIQDISAAIVTMNRRGDGIDEIRDKLVNLFVQSSTSGSLLNQAFYEASHESIPQFVRAGGDIFDVMDTLQSHADETGNSLVDMVGGSSPFYRDAQTALAILSLTGESLEELESQAVNAASAHGTLEDSYTAFGDSAQFNLDKVQSSWQSLKIETGDYVSEGLEPVFDSWLNLLNLWNGNVGTAVRQRIDLLEEEVNRTEDYVDGLSKVNQAMDDIQGSTLYTSTAEEFEQMEAIAEEWVHAIARSSTSMEEFKNSLKEAGVQIDSFGNVTIGSMWIGLQELNEIFETKSPAAIDTYAEALYRAGVTTQDLSDNTFYYIRQAEELEATTMDVALTERELAGVNYELAQSFYDTDDSWQTAVDRRHELVAANTEITQVTKARQDAIKAAAEANVAAIHAERQAFGEYVTAVDLSAENETNYIQVMYESAASKGANKYQIEQLMIATGNYDEKQIETMFIEAARQAAIQELTDEMVAGNITTSEAIDLFKDFNNQLEEDYTATFNYEDVVNGTGAAYNLKDALLSAEGNYEATFTTHNVTVNETVTKHTDQTKEGDTALYTGGRINEGGWFLVGDDHGRATPHSELLWLPAGAEVFDAETSRRMMETPPASAMQVENPFTSSGGQQVIHITYTEAPSTFVVQSDEQADQIDGLLRRERKANLKRVVHYETTR